MEDPFDEDTREFVCGILMEALSPQFAFDGAIVCDHLFALVDKIGKQFKQGNITIASPPIASPPTNTKIRPTMTTNKTITPPKY